MATKKKKKQNAAATTSATKKPAKKPTTKKPAAKKAAKTSTKKAAKKAAKTSAAKKPATKSVAKKPATTSTAKKPATTSAAKKKTTTTNASSLEADAIALIARLPANGTFEEYEGMTAEAGVARRDELVKLFATPKLRAQLKKNEYFDDQGRVQAVHFDAGWIPFAADGGGCLLCLDTNPGPQGKPLQVIQWELRGGGAFVRGPSLAAFRKSIA